MKFHLKMTLCMLAVLAALFGAGGSLLISESFEDSLEREKTAALGDYRMAWGTLQIVNSMDTYLDRDAIVKTMEQLYQQNSASWSALRLSTGDEVLYENRGMQSSLIQTAWPIEDPTPGICLFRILGGANIWRSKFRTVSGSSAAILLVTITPKRRLWSAFPANGSLLQEQRRRYSPSPVC